MHATEEAPPPTPADKTPASASFFQMQNAGPGLKRTAVRGVATTLAGQGTNLFLGLGSTAILARLLTPEDFGLIAMTAVFTGFVSLFSDAGLGTATVQRERLTDAQVSTLVWVNGLLGCIIAAIVFAIAPLVAALYSEPRLGDITRLIAVAFVFSGFGIQPRALLQRQLRFSALVIIDILALVSGIAVAITMAWRGYGYWALVGLSLGQAITSTVGVWAAVRWRPGWPRRHVGVMPMLKFGGDVMSFKLMNYFSRHSDTLLIGWRWGPVALGFYDKAYRLLMLPLRQLNRPVSAVLVPALSRLNNDPPRFVRFFLRAFELLTGVTIPLVVAVAVFADEVVYVWLGPQWSESAQLFRLLAVAAVVGVMYNPMGWLLIASGQTRRYRWIGAFNAVTCVTAFLIGLPYGAAGVAIAYSVAITLLLVPVWHYALRNSPVSLRGVLRAIFPPLAASVLAAAAGYLVLHANVTGLSHRDLTILGILTYGTVYGTVLLVGLRRWKLYWSVAQELLGQRASSA